MGGGRWGVGGSLPCQIRGPSLGSERTGILPTAQNKGSSAERKEKRERERERRETREREERERERERERAVCPSVSLCLSVTLSIREKQIVPARG